ncbi:hypothetical protein D3C86_1481520 [compost metagenome]
MLRKWTWLLPCWVWLWAFKTTSKSAYRVLRRKDGENQTLNLSAFRIDDDFVLVRDPMPARARTPRSVKAQWRREQRLRKKQERLKSKLFAVGQDLRIEELDEEE